VNPELKRKFRLPEYMAMKKVYMGNYISTQQRANVMKEAKFLKNLSNPNLIQLYLSFFEQNDRGNWYFCILMEFAE